MADRSCSRSLASKMCVVLPLSPHYHFLLCLILPRGTRSSTHCFLDPFASASPSLLHGVARADAPLFLLYNHLSPPLQVAVLLSLLSTSPTHNHGWRARCRCPPPPRTGRCEHHPQSSRSPLSRAETMLPTRLLLPAMAMTSSCRQSVKVAQVRYWSC